MFLLFIHEMALISALLSNPNANPSILEKLEPLNGFSMHLTIF
jgi:hypothetical protein